jgi:polar amino acid transport system substrate-binding protein
MPFIEWSGLHRASRVWRRTLLLLGIALCLNFQPVAAETPIRLVFAEDSAPLAFEEAGKVRGIEIDVAREVLTARLGHPIIASLYPWERAQQMARNGEADGLITVATPERLSYADCGRVPALRVPLRVMIRRNHPQMEEVKAAKKLADLRDFELVSYLGNGWAKQKLAGFNVIDAVDFRASLRGLAQGRADVAVVNAITGLYYLHELNLKGKLLMLPQDFDTLDYVLCLGRHSPHLAKLSEFDRVLEVLRADGGYARILKTYGLEPDASY